MKIITTGTKSPTAYFELSGIRNKKKLPQHPFIVFRQYTDRAVIEIVDKPEELVKLPARTKVMAQWPGKKKSDFVKFNVGQLKRHIQENPKHACQII